MTYEDGIAGGPGAGCRPGAVRVPSGPAAHPYPCRRRALDVTQPRADLPQEAGQHRAARGSQPQATIGAVASQLHRAGRSLGPVGIAAIIAAVLVTFGVAAVVVPALLASGPATKPPPPAGALPAVSAPGDTPTPDASPTGGPTASAPTTRLPRLNVGRAEEMVVQLVNNEREKASCDRVRNDDRLHDAARAHSADMAEHNKMTHTGTDRSSPAERMRDAGYRDPLGENIAAGYQTPQDVMDGWMHNRGHRENILNCHATAIGVGLAYARDGTPYWTQDFGR
jgi:uncharacterized protein YkwD